MMKKLALIVFFCLLPVRSYAIIDAVGGNFKGSPDNLEQNISDGAKALIKDAFSDIPQNELRDYHTHIIGLDKDKGAYVNPAMLTWSNPIKRLKTSVYLSGADINNIKNGSNEYIERLISLIRNIDNHGKFHILAFDHHYNKDGSINYKKSEFYTSNEYIFKLTEKYPDIFIPVISVHPYRKDALQELEKWAEKGAKWVKWLPNAHGINPSDEDITEYYQLMKKYGMTLLTHVGEEQAVEADEDQSLGNPLLFRKPLDIGVRVVMAHCASLGKDKDLDNPGQIKTSFDLFMRMMDNPKYEGLLFGEISAITQVNRIPTPLLTLLKRTDLHHRILNGSDYPLPSINAVIHTRSLVKNKMITQDERKYLNLIYQYNPLLFDYVLKRTLKHPETGLGFSPSVFVGIDNKMRDKKLPVFSTKNDYVVVLHGIARSKSHMEPVEEHLAKEGYDVINIDYPSTDYDLEQLVEILNYDMRSTLVEDKPVHFVGYSMGGILLRAYLDKYRPHNLGRVIQLASPNNGSEVADFVKNRYLYKKIYGPAGQELTTNNHQTLKLLGKVSYELGVVAGNGTIDPISSYIIDGDDDGKVSIESTKLEGMKDHIVVPASHMFFPSNEEVHEQVSYFLKHGKFIRK
ncbi:MAG: alpha/beta fold hydrolase [Rickettsiales bacterium]|nr:alpha/beta fold hydrolase [Rickettsiales bacterium]MDG4546487.1 alpha/beta fold hydrolase [Rickettsiales bacterium]MDG4548633.1 alpha/beta fold hydrolase [Rickettsiales bacterium]